MADQVLDPAPSPSAPVLAPAAPAVVADPAKTSLEAKSAAAPGDPAKTDAPKDAPKPGETPKSLLTAPIIPEKYDFAAVKLPEGIALNNDVIDAVAPVFKKLGLTQEAANELVQVHAEATAKLMAADEVKREADFKEWMKTTVTGYHDTLKKEWGVETDAKLAVAQAGMSRVMSPAAKALLDETGLGSHPEFVKAFYQVGMMTREDTPPPGGAPANSGKSAAQVLYGATTPTH